MAGDDDLASRSQRLQIEPRKIVQDVNGDARNLEEVGLRQLTSPSGLVDVATDRGHRGKRGELIKNFRAPNVTGVNDVLRASQRFQRFRSKQAMRVGDDADQDKSSQFLGFGLLISLAVMSAFTWAWDGASSMAL